MLFGKWREGNDFCRLIESTLPRGTFLFFPYTRQKMKSSKVFPVQADAWIIELALVEFTPVEVRAEPLMHIWGVHFHFLSVSVWKYWCLALPTGWSGFFSDGVHVCSFDATAQVQDFIIYAKMQAAAYRSNNIILTMGDDFNYQAADMWFSNLDKLIR